MRRRSVRWSPLVFGILATDNSLRGLIRFKKALGNKDRVEVIKINVAEGFLNKWILRGFIQGLSKRNTPLEEHDSTFLYFGNKDLDHFRDSLRLHNLLPGYVFLLDGLGRIRFAGSGTATEEEAARLVGFAKDLTPLIQQRQPPAGSSKGRPSSRGRFKRRHYVPS